MLRGFFFILLCMSYLAQVSFAPAVIGSDAVTAIITSDAVAYKERELKNVVGGFKLGDEVEILEDYSMKSYKVRGLENKKEGWVLYKYLKIAEDSGVDKTELYKDQIEEFVNIRRYNSKTEFLVLVDIGRQKTYVMRGNQGEFRFERSFDCSTGVNVSPTTKGEFVVGDRGEWFYSERLKSGAKYWVRFNNHYLFHTVPMDKAKRVLKGEDFVGEKLSSGCIRHTIEDAKWIYDNIPEFSKVVIL